MLSTADLSSSPALAALRLPVGVSSASRTCVIHHKGRQSQVVKQVDDDAPPDIEYDDNWAGAGWSKEAGTFSSVTGTFRIPTPSGSVGDSASAWVGIDGISYEAAILQTGVDMTVSSNGPKYEAWYEFYPAESIPFSDFTISAGDIIKLTVTSTSSTSGTAKVENLTSGQTVSQVLNSAVPLGGQDAEWIVEDHSNNGSLVALANFDTITFFDAEATGSQSYTPPGGTIYDISHNNTVLTTVSTEGKSVTIQYMKQG